MFKKKRNIIEPPMLIKLLDVEYWWTDLRSANEQMIEPEWEKRYSAKVSYNMEDMTVNS